MFSGKENKKVAKFKEDFMKKKVIASILVMMMVLGIAGCGKSTSTENSAAGNTTTDTASTTETSTESSNFNETGYPIVNEPITLDVMLSIRDVDTMIEPNDMQVIKDLEAKTGIHINWEVIKGSDWDTKVNLMFASGEYPDIILATTAPLDDEEYGVTQQILLPLDDLITQYMPTYTERIAAESTNPVSGLVASDGKTYSVGYMVGQNINTNMEFFINQTWLTALGLEMPKTLDQLTETLRQFKNNDPNGNGQADEVAVEMGLDTGFYGIRYMLPMFGIPCDPAKWIYIDDNKQVQLTPVQPGFRQAMEWFHTMYTEGVIDAEMVSQDINTIETKLKAGNIGFFNAWRITAMGFDDGVMKDSVLYTPVGPEGTKASMYRLIEMANDGAYITNSNENVGESLRWLDALLDTETMFSMYYGPNGWIKNADGQIESTVTGNEEIKEWLDVNSLFFAPGEYISKTFKMSPQRVEKTLYCQAYEAAGVLQTYSNDYLKLAPLTSEKIQSTTLIETDINNAVVEYAANFIINGVTDDQWNNFVKLFDDMGAADYVKIYQDGINQVIK